MSEKVPQEPQIPFSTTTMTIEALQEYIKDDLVDGVEDSLQISEGEPLLTGDANNAVYATDRGLVHDRAGSPHTHFVVRRIEAVDEDMRRWAFSRIAVLSRADKLILWTRSTDKVGTYYIVTKLALSKGRPYLPVPPLEAESGTRKLLRDHLVTLYRDNFKIEL